MSFSVFRVFLDVYPGVESLGHMAVLFLVVRENSILFSTVAAPIYVPTNSVQGFPFLHIVANICYLCSFDDSHSDRCEVTYHCGFDLHFPEVVLSLPNPTWLRMGESGFPKEIQGTLKEGKRGTGG